MTRQLSSAAVFLCTGLLLYPLRAAEPSPSVDEIRLKDVLVIRSLTRPGRSAVRVDPIEAQVVAGTWKAPAAGDSVAGPDGEEQKWETASANDQGSLAGSTFRGGYVFWPVVSDRERVMLLEAAGNGCVYVNGEIRGGDSYGFGYFRLPVLLRSGTNEFLFPGGRGDLRVKLLPPSGPLSIHTADSTLPDIIAGETEPLWGAVVLLNATTKPMRAGLRVLDRESPEQFVELPPLGMFKAPFLMAPPLSTPSNSCAIVLEATDHSGAAPARAEVNLRVRQPNETHVRTFRSGVEDSVQYYAVNPAPGPAECGQALFLSLHGAGVEARGQAESYMPKKWGNIVAPTNRRPYGFDWEEWGRWDALEVLGQATARFQPDPRRIYLTGHSMGGHGTWQLGAHFPDRFAAIAPSAGWISFRSYIGGRSAPAITNAVQQMLLRAGAASETLLLATNYAHEGVYILHGDADDNVPVTQAREMRRVLGEFHRDFDFFEQPGAGHWWDASDEPGTDCVDWAPMFDFFARRVIPTDESLRRIRFTTVNPAVSARCHWVTIVSQERALEPSSVDLRCDPGRRRIVGVTTNINCLALDFPTIAAGAGLTLEFDGQKLEKIELPESGCCEAPRLWLVRSSGTWSVGKQPDAALKSPERSGPVREAYRNHMVLVYATQGTPEENAWSLAKARYDSEAFYYRGNASVELMADTDVVAGKAMRGSSWRNVILYGHADCNAAWSQLLGKSPVQVRRGSMRVGNRELSGTDLACLFLQPHPQDAGALVGVVAGSGLPGLRVTERMPLFISGAGFPDCLVFGADLPAKGLGGIRCAGFFGNDWQVDSGEFAWTQ